MLMVLHCQLQSVRQLLLLKVGFHAVAPVRISSLGPEILAFQLYILSPKFRIAALEFVLCKINYQTLSHAPFHLIKYSSKHSLHTLIFMHRGNRPFPLIAGDNKQRTPWPLMADFINTSFSDGHISSHLDNM